MLFVLLAAAASLAAQPVTAVRAGLIYHVEGAVSADGEPLDPASLLLVQLGPGSSLETRRGFAEIALGPDRCLRVAPETELVMVQDDIEDAAFRLVRGSAIVDWSFRGKGSKVRIETSGAVIEIKRSGLVRVDARRGPARVRVIEGRASVSGESLPGDFEARKGSELVLNEGAPEEREIDPRRRDFFDRWSARRARAAARMTRAGVPKRRPSPRGGYNGASGRFPDPEAGGGDPF